MLSGLGQIQHHEATLQRIAGIYTVIKATIMNPIRKIRLSKLKDNTLLWNFFSILESKWIGYDYQILLQLCCGDTE